MLQTIYDHAGSTIEELTLPAADVEVFPGVRWGLAEALFSPAYWRSQFWFRRRHCDYTDYRRGATLREEVAACLLGGHGITAEVNDAAFERLRARGLLNGATPPLSTLETALEEALVVGQRSIRYRFPRQKARFLCEALERLGAEEAPAEHHAFRAWFLTFPGIGPKIASWITRNWLDSNDVAIIDIHVFRALTLAGVIDGRESIARDYGKLEAQFLRFAIGLGIEARRLDAFLWRHMKDAGAYGVRAFDRWMARKDGDGDGLKAHRQATQVAASL